MATVGVDRSEQGEPPADRDARTSADNNAGPQPAQAAMHAGRPLLADREQRVAEQLRYRANVERAESEAAARAWSEAVPELRDAWEKIKVKYGHTERERAVAQPADGSWRGEGGRKLDAAQNAEVDQGYARIREAGERSIVPALKAVEAEDPARRLAGFEHRFKGLDRLKEKVADQIRSTPGTSPAQALSAVPDAVRATYLYDDAAYAAGVRRDADRLEARGYVQVVRRNTWMSDQYKGINSRWREPESGVVFEVQFHTQASLAAKELTHKAYEQIRSITDRTPESERETADLKGFQRQVNAKIPIPPGVTEYEDYRPERRNGRRD